MAKVEVGEVHVVYDPRIWYKRKRDFELNRDCWKRATIVKVYQNSFPTKDCEEMADVVFLYDGYLSHGHFTSMMDRMPAYSDFPSWADRLCEAGSCDCNMH